MVCYVKPCFVTAALWIFFSLLSAQNGKWSATLSPALLPQRFEFFFAIVGSNFQFWARWLLHRKRLRLNAGSCLATPRLFVRGVQFRWDTDRQATNTHTLNSWERHFDQSLHLTAAMLDHHVQMSVFIACEQSWVYRRKYCFLSNIRITLMHCYQFYPIASVQAY